MNQTNPTEPNDEKNTELSLAREYVEETGCHLFLTGKAGTGKTTFLKNLTQDSSKRLIVTAPTGVAAINAGGVTLHSFFQLPLGPYVPDSEGFLRNKDRFFRFSNEKKKIIKSLDLLVIDEVSMVRADMLDAVDAVLRHHRRNDAAFGGVQLLLIGDLYQLPPVVKTGEWALLRSYYQTAYFFNSLALGRVDLITLELKKVYRQEDERFIRLLNTVRENRMDDAAVNTLNTRLDPAFSTTEHPGYITLTTHNRLADRINQEKLDAIDDKEYRLNAEISGDFPEHTFPTFPLLSLKKGAQVMFLRNDTSPEKRFYNGKIGRVTAISSQTIQVSCPDDPGPVAVEPVEWQNIKYTINEETREIEEETIGRFEQFPLKPAWAITIHKSQGLTFDKAVIDAGAAFAQGQVYVALSRCRSLDGLILSSPIPERGIKTDRDIHLFLSRSPDKDTLVQRLAAEKALFQQQLLIQCFDFRLLKNRLGYFFGLAERTPDLVRLSHAGDIQALKARAHNDIFRVGESFKQQLAKHFPKEGLVAENAYIQQRVQKASEWFETHLKDIFGNLMENLEIETDNKTLAKKLKNALDNLKLEITVRKTGIRSCKNGFSPVRYLSAVSKAETEAIPQSRARKKAVVYDETDMDHPELFEKLRQWRLALSKEKEVPAYQILHQRALIQLVVRLPRTPDELMQTPGIGPKTVSSYGEDILEIIIDFCNEHDIEQAVLPEKKEDSTPTEKPKVKKEKIDTKKFSFDLFNEGLTPAEIAEKRGLVQNTILGHLAHYIGIGELDVSRVLSPEKQTRIEKAMVKVPNSHTALKRLKSELDDDISYGEIKFAIAHLRYRESKSDNTDPN